MILQNWFFTILIGIIATYLLMSILYNNCPEVRQKFSDLGAIIQLQTSRPAYYANWVPENQGVYNDVLNSYGIPQNNMSVGTREMKNGLPMAYPIPYGMAYPEDYPVQYPPVAYSTNPYYPPRTQPQTNPYVNIKNINNNKL